MNLFHIIFLLCFLIYVFFHIIKSISPIIYIDKLSKAKIIKIRYQQNLINQTTSDSVAVFSGNTSLIVPVGTTAQRPSTPPQGMIRYNTTSNTTEIYDGSSWQDIGSSSSSSTSDGSTLILIARNFV